jgi:hypothetical protein
MHVAHKSNWPMLGGHWPSPQTRYHGTDSSFLLVAFVRSESVPERTGLSYEILHTEMERTRLYIWSASGDRRIEVAYPV